MNKSAVAMAADSAVTISAGRQGVKTFDTVNKLFELVKGRPIGFMVYANAELNGMPWETIIKAFRDEHRGLNLPYLEDYVDKFYDYLRKNSELISKDSETRLVIDSSYNALIRVFSYVRERQDTCVSRAGRPVMTRIRALIDEAIADCEAVLQQAEDAPWGASIDAERIRSQYGTPINLLVEELFANYKLSRATRERLAELAISYLLKLISDPGHSGVVFAGFGERDYFPKMYSSNVRGFLDGRPLQHGDFTVEIQRNYPGHLHTFAQDEEAKAYLSGITANVRDQIIGYWSNWVLQSELEISSILDQFSKLKEEEKDQIAKAFFDYSHGKVHEFLQHMQDHQDSEYLNPIWESISFLPKDELAVLAESLVNLTSLKQRVSIRNLQTVGGAIDVALISRGDGFVWLKRKHYFSSELNPSWHLTHRGTIAEKEESRLDARKRMPRQTVTK